MENQNLNNSQWEKVEPAVWKPNEGDILEGVLIQKRENGGKYDNPSYVIENDQGQHLMFATTVLKSRLELVNKGDSLRITFEGMKPNQKGQNTKMFKVERQKSS